METGAFLVAGRRCSRRSWFRPGTSSFFCGLPAIGEVLGHAHPMVAIESLKDCPQTIARLPVDGEGSKMRGLLAFDVSHGVVGIYVYGPTQVGMGFGLPKSGE